MWSATGIPGLDQLMNGGPKATDATLVTGPSGVGKTIFGLRWTAQALEQGQHRLAGPWPENSVVGEFSGRSIQRSRMRSRCGSYGGAVCSRTGMSPAGVRARKSPFFSQPPVTPSAHSTWASPTAPPTV